MNEHASECHPPALRTGPIANGPSCNSRLRYLIRMLGRVTGYVYGETRFGAFAENGGNAMTLKWGSWKVGRTPADDQRSGTRPSLDDADWSEMLSHSVIKHQDASGPGIVSSEGVFQVPYSIGSESGANTQPVGAVSGVVFVYSQEQGKKTDLFALVQQDPKIRVSQPTYMGTFDISSQYLEQTEATLKNLGVSVSRLLDLKSK